MVKTDLQALYLSGTYCLKTGTRPPSCQAPRQPTKNVVFINLILRSRKTVLSGLAFSPLEAMNSSMCSVSSHLIPNLNGNNQPIPKDFQDLHCIHTKIHANDPPRLV